MSTPPLAALAALLALAPAAAGASPASAGGAPHPGAPAVVGLPLAAPAATSAPAKAVPRVLTQPFSDEADQAPGAEGWRTLSFRVQPTEKGAVLHALPTLDTDTDAVAPPHAPRPAPASDTPPPPPRVLQPTWSQRVRVEAPRNSRSRAR